ncbi:MAG: hypothetical protein IJK67_02770 [Bacilli bacterium]|nr:hypothetical protein [Bacilli bacterium]
MKNKILVDIYVPSFDEEYNIFIPLNKNIADVILLIGKSISEMKLIEEVNFNNYSLYNRETTLKYKPEMLVRETNIRNGVRLILM